MNEPESPLVAALDAGDPERVASLLAKGHDLNYVRADGYDALIDAVHGRDVLRDPRLLELLRLLIERSARLSSVTTYGESGLRVLSRLGRFDAVRLLLEAGADEQQLGWTPLIEAVALGSLADVEVALRDGAELEARDFWDRTAWLVALLTGDINKAGLLRDRGADVNARGRCGQLPLYYAIQGHHPNVVRWLLENGQTADDTNDFGSAPLMTAVEEDDVECVELLLASGADPNRKTGSGSVLQWATTRAIVLRLLESGANPSELSNAGRRVLVGLPAEPDPKAFEVSVEHFSRAQTRRFGRSNPERMQEPFWEAMIRSGLDAYEASNHFAEPPGKQPPVFCANRFGQSVTFLPDGRVVQIAGEHEDHYDPDFCIYNDVFVHEPDGTISIYGYPERDFPPTDFHTATLAGRFVYVIGSLGYLGHRRFGETQVLRLDTEGFRMERFETAGEAPGWIFGHRAALASPSELRVWSGTVVLFVDGKEHHVENTDSFVLDLDRKIWRRQAAPKIG